MYGRLIRRHAALIRLGATGMTLSVGHNKSMFTKAAKFASYYSDDADEAEIIEIALSLALPQRRAVATAELLLSTFGSYAKVISAPFDELLKVEGLGDCGALVLKIIQVSSQRLLKPDYKEPIILRDFVALIPYLQALLRYETIENFRVIYLNKKNCVIENALISQGEIGFVQLCARKIAKKALDVNASSLILVHNHPSGDCTPSRQDISQTKILQEALEIFEITVHDHLVIGNGSWSSLKNLGYI